MENGTKSKKIHWKAKNRVQNRCTDDRDCRIKSGRNSKMEQKARKRFEKKQRIVCETVALATETVGLEAAGYQK